MLATCRECGKLYLVIDKTEEQGIRTLLSHRTDEHGHYITRKVFRVTAGTPSTSDVCLRPTLKVRFAPA